MAPTYNELLEYLLDVRGGHYQSLPEQAEAKAEAVASILSSLLEKLRDEHEPLNR